MRKVVAVAVTSSLLMLLAPSAFAYLMPDDTFGTNSTTVVGSDGRDVFQDVISLEDGYLAAGMWNDDKIVLTKFDSSGDPDPTFGVDGRRVVAVDEYLLSAHVDERPTGGYLVTAWTARGFVLVAVDADGLRDDGFSGNGILRRTVSPSPTGGRIYSAIDSQERIVVATSELTSNHAYASDIHVWRFTSAGEPDATFAGADVVASPARVNNVAGVETDGANRVWVVTAHYTEKNPRAGMSLVRISESGRAVQTMHRLSVWQRDGTYPIGITQRPDGALLVGITGATTARVGAAAFSTTGELVTNYGDAGVVRGPCSSLCYIDQQYLDPQGRLVLVGGVDSDTESRAIIDDSWMARFTTDGRRDNRFTLSWQQEFSVARGSDSALGVTLDDTGRLIVAGYVGKDAYLKRWAE